MDAAAQLQRLYLAGFEIQSFERFPRTVGVVRDNCVALLEPTAEGLKIVAMPGWLMDGGIGVPVQSGGRQVFQHKSETVEATPERLETLRRFRQEVENLLAATA
jgi:hypothetical protein